MKRAKLTAARLARGWSQEVLAEKVDVTRSTVSEWERGIRDPYPVHVQCLCTIFAMSAEDLDLVREGKEMTFKRDEQADSPASRPSHVLPFEGASSIREGQDMDEIRRQLLQQLLEIGGVTFLASELGRVTEPTIAPEEFLPQCANALKASWYLLHSNGISIASEMLASYIPTLMTLTFRPSRYQETAASLATQAKILQAVLAMHRSDLTSREMHCLEAVRCGRLSCDGGLLAAALMYVGYTYTYCLPRPEKAVVYFQEAIQALGSETSLLRSDIYIGLADAYAKIRDEPKALEMLALAQNHFPSYPEQDPRFLYADCRWSELYQWEGKTYLDLAQHYPEKGYYQKANSAFIQSAALQPVRDLSTSETLLNQAEAARGLDDLRHYETCLREGTLKALSTGSQKRYNEAYSIFQRTPEKWLHEKPIRDLATEVFQLPGRTIYS